MIKIIAILALFISFCFISSLVAKDKFESYSCPKPYIKLIKPNLAKFGQQIVIRGYRFGYEEKESKVIFTPGISGKIIHWRYSRIIVEVPLGAKSGKVVVETCKISNGEYFKVVEILNIYKGDS